MIRGLVFLLLMHIATTVNARQDGFYTHAAQVLRKQVLKEAKWAMLQRPETITAATSPLSAGNKHDFFSQADYFWPNPGKPGGIPYMNKDGETNPGNFVVHRKAMIRFSRIIGSLAAAYKLTGNKQYVAPAIRHLRAWFADSETRMNPDLQYAQAVIGASTGRSWGIIDAIHLVEVARGTLVLQNDPGFDQDTREQVKAWFTSLINWLNTSKNGIAERDAKNNHSTCWVMQVAAFAKLCGDQKMMNFCSNLYKNVLLPGQMAIDGSFPLELERTKPYGYSIFNLDAMTMVCQILSTPENDLWNYTLADGRSIKRGLLFLYPFVKDKSTWKFKQDVMYWNSWPVAQPFLLFGGKAIKNIEWFGTWQKLDHQPAEAEVIRNLPVRNPLIWFN